MTLAQPQIDHLINAKRGALWRHWDLHVHTPCSIRQNYGGDNPEAWEAFLKDLERLPFDSVIGINDYIFLDGYKKLLDFKSRGRIQNIAKILPIIELRLDRFGGTEGNLSRVNLHVIFSDQIDADTIEAQFINALSASYQLSPEYAGAVRWQGIPTRKSISDLGDKIKQVLPAQSSLKNEGSLALGFSNLNISIEKVKEILRGEYFSGLSLTAIGKTEWYDIKWNEASIAEKKTIINSVDMVFTAAKTIEDWRKSKKQLQEASVNSRLLDCSDAHHFSDSLTATHMKIGGSFTWIKSDPSFEGLRHAVCQEYDTRVFIGDRPPQLTAIQNNPSKFISAVKFTKNLESQLSESWFDGQEVHFNAGLVAIIGNKGSGKSALADMLGLLGNCKLEKKHFAFLNKNHFLDPKQNKASHFIAELSWESKQKISKGLHQDTDNDQPETIKYIPQSYLEELCNQNQENPGESSLEIELKAVILSHIPVEDRLGCNSLDALIEEHTRGHQDEIEGLRTSLISINREICLIEDQLKPAHKTKLTNELAAKQTEVAQHDAIKPTAVQDPKQNNIGDLTQQRIVGRLVKWQNLLDKNAKLIENASAKLTKNQTDQVLAKNCIQTLSQAFDRFAAHAKSVSEDLLTIGITLTDVLTLDLNTDKIREKQEELRFASEVLQSALNPFDGKLYIRKVRIEHRVEKLQEKLAGPSKAYQGYLTDLKKWENIHREMVGSLDKPGSLNYLFEQIRLIDEAPVKYSELLNNRADVALLIGTRSLELLDLYRSLYRPVQEFIEKRILHNDHYQLSFEAKLQCEGLPDRLLHFINHGKAGSFYGIEEGRKRVDDLIEKTDFQTINGLKTFLAQAISLLHFNHRIDPPARIDLDSQLTKTVKSIELYNFLFGLDYLVPRFSLRMGNRPIEQLSPGEKGLLLLAFYLLLDKDCRPLVIDQPEENLDNQTVHQLLVPCIKEARSRRQVILVTHNPNVAVVCDADQVIVASMQKRGNYEVLYESGSIESPAINSKIVDILEGTMRAFRNRDFKYHRNL